jgi:hypothetical protein
MIYGFTCSDDARGRRQGVLVLSAKREMTGMSKIQLPRQRFE